jgi:hypothetical protein
MARISARTCSSPARRRTGSPCVAPRDRSKGGKPRPTEPTIAPSSRLIGSSSRPGAHRGRSRPSGGSMSIGRANRIRSCALASRTAGPATRGLSAPGRRRRGAASISRRRSTLKRCRRPVPGRPVRRGGNATNAARASKAPCRKGCGPSASAARGIGACRKHTSSTWPSPPRSLSLGWSRGWRNNHGPQHGPRALRHWRLCMTSPRSPPPSEPCPYSSPGLLRSRQAAHFYFLLQ